MPAPTWSPPATAVDPAYFPVTKRFRFGWVVEAAVLVVLLLLHDTLRNAVMGSRYTAFDNAKTLTSIERFFGIYHELGVQRFFIDAGTPFIGFWNFWFETMHFIVPLVVAVYLYRKFPGRYVRMRNAFLVMLFLTAPFVWGVFPVTPPKFMPARYGFVDTEVEFWNIVPQDPIKYDGPNGKGEPSAESVALEGNLYGGIPSHHLSWALWCALALWPVVRRRWLRNLLLLYPAVHVHRGDRDREPSVHRPPGQHGGGRDRVRRRHRDRTHARATASARARRSPAHEELVP